MKKCPITYCLLMKDRVLRGQTIIQTTMYQLGDNTGLRLFNFVRNAPVIRNNSPHPWGDSGYNEQDNDPLRSIASNVLR